MNNNPYFNYYTYPNFQNINFRSVPSSFINGPLRNPIMGGITKNPGFLSRIFAPTSSISAGVTGATKTFSFSNLLNGASKTLNVINQAIPVVKQVGPMFNNMKSMLKVASLFNDATTPTNSTRNNNTKNTTNIENNNKTKENTTTNNSYSNSPNFFI